MMAPVVAFMLSPPGKLTAEYEYGVVPPLAEQLAAAVGERRLARPQVQCNSVLNSAAQPRSPQNSEWRFVRRYRSLLS